MCDRTLFVVNTNAFASRARPETRFTALVLYFAGIAIYSVMYIPQPILPTLSAEYGIAPAIAALSVSLAVLAVAIASSFFGPLTDTLGTKQVMVASCGLLAIPTFLCAIAPNFPIFLVFRAMQGLLLPGVASVAVTYIGAAFQPGDVGRVVGNYIGATVVGGMTGRVLSGLIASVTSWHAPFVFFAVVTALTAFLMSRVLPEQATTGQSGMSRAQRDMFLHLGNKKLLGAFLVGGCVFFAFIGTFTYLPYYLTAPPFSLPQALVSGAYAVYIAGVFASPVAGRLSARIPRRTLMVAGMAIAGLGILISLIAAIPAIALGTIVLCLGMFTAQSTPPGLCPGQRRDRQGWRQRVIPDLLLPGRDLGLIPARAGLAGLRLGGGGGLLRRGASCRNCRCAEAMQIADLGRQSLSLSKGRR